MTLFPLEIGVAGLRPISRLGFPRGRFFQQNGPGAHRRNRSHLIQILSINYRLNVHIIYNSLFNCDGLWTGQRQGDLLALPWSAYAGTTIRLRQSKTGTAVAIKVEELLDKTPRRSTLILPNQKGVPWTPDGFRTSWGKMVAKVGIEGLNFHDLRDSTLTRLALEGSQPRKSR
jgi:integrase